MFWKHLTGFKKNFRANAQDGAPDVLTGIIEKNIVFKGTINETKDTDSNRSGIDKDAGAWIDGYKNKGIGMF